MSRDDAAYLRTILSTLDVMEYLGSSNGEPVRLTDISRNLHYSKTKVYRILSTLERRKYVWQDPATHGYHLGLRTWLLGRNINVYHILSNIAEPYVDELAAQSQETSIFAVLEGIKTVHLYVSQTPNLILANVSPGSRVPLHASATGKAILSKLDANFIPQMLPLVLERFTSHTIIDRNKLVQEISKIQQMGYATGIDELSAGLAGVAAASAIKNQMVYWAIGISGPTSRLSSDRLKELGELAVKTVCEIDQKLNTEVN